jgi:hypothetical protein
MENQSRGNLCFALFTAAMCFEKLLMNLLKSADLDMATFNILSSK